VASLQFGAAGLATLDESADAIDAAMTLTAVTAETAKTMAFFIDVPSFDSPAWVCSLFDVRRRRELLGAPQRRACPSSSQECDTSPLSCQQGVDQK
jgi:hypothetical protein